MAQMGQLFRFYLTYNGATVETMPTNWDGMELQVNRTDNVVNRAISLEFEFYGAGATLLHTARDAEGHNAVVTITIDKRKEDWTYLLYKSMKADMTTYTEQQAFVSVGFMEKTLRQQIEDKQDTVYEIDADEDYKLSYTGINRIRENVFTGVVGGMKDLNGYNIPKAYRTTAQYSQAIQWSDNDYVTTYDALRFKIKAERPITLVTGISITIKRTIYAGNPPSWASLGLFCRHQGTNNCIFEIKDTGTVVNGSLITKPFSASWSTGGFGWRKSTFTIPEFTYSIPLTTLGDEYFWGYSSARSGVWDVEVVSSDSSMMQVTENAESVYINRVMPVIHHERIIEKLLAKMAITNADGSPMVVGTGITYNLPTESSNDGFIVAYGSTDCLLQKTSPKMAISLSGAMSLVKMRFAACLSYTETGLVVDLVTNQYNHAVEVEIDPISDLVISTQDSLIYGSVEIGYKTDEKDATNVAKEVICRNTYTIPSGKGDAYSLATDTICSPYCIEARLEGLLSDDTNSETKDNTIFAFAVYPLSASYDDYEGYYFNGIFYTTTAHTTPMSIMLNKIYKDLATGNRYLSTSVVTVYTNINGYYFIADQKFYSNAEHTILIPEYTNKTYTDIPTGVMYIYYGTVSGYHPFIYARPFELTTATPLDKRHTGVDATYYNIPLSPMRCLKAHAKSIGVSCVGGAPSVVFASTERTADCITKMSYEGTTTDEKVPDASITALLASPYYLPSTAEFTANWKIPSLATLQNNVLYTAFEQKSGRSIKGYINILTLQLSKVESQQINLLAHEI